MRNARIFLVEDDLLSADTLCELLSTRGCEVVIRASTLKGALAIVEDCQLQNKRINLAIVDANFPNDIGEPETLCGPLVAEAIRKSDASIKIVAFSGDPDELKYGDKYVYKGDGAVALLRAINFL